MNYWSINMWNLVPCPNPDSGYLDEDQYDQYIKTLDTVDYDGIILFCQTEFEFFNIPRYEEIVELSRKNNKKIYAIVGLDHDYKNLPDNIEVICWPTNFFREGLEQVCHWYNTGLRDTQDLDKILINNLDDLDYKHHFIYLNGKSHDHRCQLIDVMASEDLLKHSAYSWYANYMGNSPYNFKYYSGDKKILDQQFDTIKDQGWVPKEYYQSFFQVVPETTVRAKFITEKTIVPLLIGKPFLIAAAKGINRKLESLGFKLYDELFDYSFDDIEDDQQRFIEIGKVVKRLTELPLHELRQYHKVIQDKISYNREKVIELAFDQNIVPDLVKEIINHYDSTGKKIDWWLIETELRVRDIKNKYF